MRPLAHALAALALGVVATAQGSAEIGESGAPDRVAEARARWETMGAAERAVLRERFAKLQELAPEERAALESLARRLKAREEEVREALSEPARAQLAELPAPERGAVVREHVQDALAREGADVRARLPEELVERVEAERPLRRPAVLDALLSRSRPLGARDARRLGAALDLPDDEIAALERLDPSALEQRVLALHRDGIDRAVRELGPPPGLDAEGYAAMRAMPHQEFFRRWRALDPPEAYGAPPGRRAAPSLEARRGAPLFKEALRLLHPTLEDRVALARAPRGEREAALGARIRARVIAFVEEHALVERAELDALRAADGPSFPRVGRRILEARRKALFGSRR